MKVEVTLQFEVDEDCDLDTVHQIVKDRIKNFNYKEEFVQWNYIIPGKTQGFIATQERLNQLENAIEVFNENIKRK